MNRTSNLPEERDVAPGASKIKVFIHERSLMARLASWKLKEQCMALTVGRHIFLWQVSKVDFLQADAWVAHELAHVRQYNKYGLLRFIAVYLWESFKKGYYLNRLEIEARRQSVDLSILDHYVFI